jgi:hypothetical protein
MKDPKQDPDTDLKTRKAGSGSEDRSENNSESTTLDILHGCNFENKMIKSGTRT